jgi:hypothetical protein
VDRMVTPADAGASILEALGQPALLRARKVA